LRLHDLRNSFGKVKSKRKNALTIKAFTGHKTLMMTSESLRHAIERLDQAISKKLAKLEVDKSLSFGIER
jgi:integrase